MTLVSEAESELRKWLDTSGVRDDGRLPSERTLAKMLGVGHYALNRAMARLITEGLVGRDGYKLFRRTHTLSEPSFSCHLVIYGRSAHLKTFCKIAKELSIELDVRCFANLEDAIAILNQLLTEDTVPIVFDPPLYGMALWQNTVEAVAKHGIPIVCIGNYLKGVPSIMIDIARALELLFEQMVELGHRELAFMGFRAFTQSSAEVLEEWDKCCKRFGLPASSRRVYLPERYLFLRDEVVELANRLVGDWQDVTALIAFNEPDSTMSLLVEMLAKRKKTIPSDLSVACLTDSSALAALTPPITAASFSMSTVHETALRMAQRYARSRKSPKPLPACHIRIEPEVMDRGSIVPHPSKAGAAPLPPSRSPSPHIQETTAKTEVSFKSAFMQAYPLVKLVDNARFKMLDLAEFVNRPLNFQRGWLGDRPLKHLDPGNYTIHGVPFQVLGGSQRSDCGVIVFHSVVNTKGNAQSLPVQLRIPIQSKAKAVYVLHGCGYTRSLKCFARYGFYSQEKKLDEVPLVPLGLPSPDFNLTNPPAEFAKVNIQDWWADLPHMNFEHAHMVPIPPDGNAERSQWHAFLYTLEWVNPTPETPVDYLQIEVDPLISTTLGILGVTILKP